VYGENCSGCPQNADSYHPGSSSTNIPCSGTNFQCSSCNNNACGFYDQYGDGSHVGGYIVNDTFAFAGSDLKAIASFGSIEDASPNFEPTSVDGIFGLSWPTTSSWGGVSPMFDYMSQNNLYMGFSMCLKNSSHGSSIQLGVDASSLHSVAWTPLFSDVYYAFDAEDILVNGKSLGVPARKINGEYGALVDSGTTLIILTDDVFSVFQSSVESLCSQYNLPGVCNAAPGQSLFDGYCYPMSKSDIANFPKFAVKAKGISTPLEIGPETYMVSNQGTECLGIAPGGGLGVTILGDTFMRNFAVLFDIEKKQVGFMPQKSSPFC